MYNNYQVFHVCNKSVQKKAHCWHTLLLTYDCFVKNINYNWYFYPKTKYQCCARYLVMGLTYLFLYYSWHAYIYIYVRLCLLYIP